MALAVDASTPAFKEGAAGTGTTLTSNSFSPPAGSVIAVYVGNSLNTTLITSISDNLGAHLSYSKLISQATNSCTAEIWAASCPAAQTGMTVTVTFASSISDLTQIVIGIIVWTGAAATQAGSTKGATSTAALPSATLTSAASTSWIVGVVTNFSNGTGPTIPGTQTDVFNGNTMSLTSGGDAWWIQGNNAVGNSNLTINDTAPSIQYSMAIAEIQAAPARVASVPARGPLSL